MSKDLDFKKWDIGVFIGRFQVHQLHDAHCDIIEQVINNHKKVILFLGVSPVIGSTTNPLDFTSRKLMIQQKYPDIVILSLPDKRDDESWSKNLDSRIREIYYMEVETHLFHIIKDNLILLRLNKKYMFLVPKLESKFQRK